MTSRNAICLPWLQNRPPHPSRQLHCHDFSHVPCWHPGYSMHSLHSFPCHPMRHLKPVKANVSVWCKSITKYETKKQTNKEIDTHAIWHNVFGSAGFLKYLFNWEWKDIGDSAKQANTGREFQNLGPAGRVYGCRIVFCIVFIHFYSASHTAAWAFQKRSRPQQLTRCRSYTLKRYRQKWHVFTLWHEETHIGNQPDPRYVANGPRFRAKWMRMSGASNPIALHALCIRSTVFENF